MMDRNNCENSPLIILTGPTAVGKTALSIGLAKEIGGEIISADSMQVYRGMDIGTAKITKEEMQGIPHYLIDELDPKEEFHVAYFQKKCKEYMEQIYGCGNIPMIVGGTGFYIQSVLYDIDFTKSEADGEYRREQRALADQEGNKALYEKLRQIDPEAAQKIHPNNVKRIIRALEYYKQTGKKISEHNEIQRQNTSPYRFVYYVLNLPRQILYDRINRRVDEMRERGLTQEVKRLKMLGCQPDMVSMKGLGYKQLLSVLNEEGTAPKTALDEAYEQIKLETRHFAKRQLTWFRRERDVTWLNKEEFMSEEELLQYCVKDIQERVLGI